MSRARLIYFVIVAILIVSALLAARCAWPEGLHDGGQI